jgi:hypothetical protein
VVGKQRIDVAGDDLRIVDEQRRQAHQGLGDGVAIGLAPPPVRLQPLGDAGAGDHLPGQRQVERRQGDGVVAH